MSVGAISLKAPGTGLAGRKHRASMPDALMPDASMQDSSGWRYNRWLGRWRQPATADPGPASTGGTFTRTLSAADTREAAFEADERSMPIEESDVALVERVKAGDVRAFESLHRRYYNRIYRLAFTRLGNTEDASDVACNTFCRALKSLPNYQFRRTTSLYPWLHQIASNLVVDVVRDRPAGGMLSLDAQAAEDVDSFLEYLPADGPSPQELVEREEVRAMVIAAIQKLPADQSRALSMRFLSDLSIREIAQALDRTEGAVKSLLHRALVGVRHHLKSEIAEAREGAELEEATDHARHTTPGKVNSHGTELLHVRQRDA